MTGDWVWSSDEEDAEEDADKNKSKKMSKTPKEVQRAYFQNLNSVPDPFSGLGGILISNLFVWIRILPSTSNKKLRKP